MRRASMARPESVSARIASVGSRMPICTISLRFFSPPEKPTFTGRLSMSMSSLSNPAFSRASLRKSPPDSGSCPRALRSEEHTSELQSLLRLSYAVLCLKTKKPRQYLGRSAHYQPETQRNELRHKEN